MLRRPGRLVVLACVLAVSAALLAVPSAAVPRQAQGVDKDSYDVVVLVADVDALRASGFNIAEKLTVANFAQRWQGYFDAAGKVNGRSINVITVGWDPVDPTSYEETCIKATQDNKPFAVMNANGYRQSSVGCITVDNDTFMFFGESVYGDLQKASGKNLVSLGVPAEQTAATTMEIAIEQKSIAKNAKIGILSGNEPANKAAGDTAEKILEKNGYDVASKVEVNVVGQDVTGQQRDATAAVATMQDAGVQEVIVTLGIAVAPSFFDEANKSGAGFEYTLIDVAASSCTQFGASRTPLVIAELGMPCVTANDSRALPTKDGIEQDTAFEAQCRKTWDATFNETSQPGVPAGDTKDAAGNTLTEDFQPNECTMVNLFVKGLKKAGKNATTDDLFDALMTIKKAPAAYQSDGSGGFAKNKPYFATKMHLVVLNPANTSTATDANGLYNGCPAPVNCWIPQEIDGVEWFPVGQAP